MCEDSCAINPPLLLEYFEAKIQMLSQNVKMQIFLFLKARVLLEVKLLELERKIGQIQLNLENVGAYDIKKILQESHILTILQYNKVN